MLHSIVSSEAAADVTKDASKYWELKFLSSPIQFLGTTDGSVRAVKLEHNELTVS